ncbi:baseplate wedge subunit [Synechococcus phage S-8S29]|nr:baseplate wedge subunit [Synechococcus phage S-8S29]
MAALLTDQFRIFSAKKFIKALEGPIATQSDDDAGTSRDRLYLFIGRPQSWDNENSPPQAVDSFSEFSSSYDDMVSLKRVLASDTIQVVRRIDWVSPEQTTGGLGFTYDMYRQDYSPSKTASSGATKLYDSDFYVVNSQYQVYKCIYNGTSPSDPNGKPSTVEPTGTSTSIITTGDSYRWKYMYTIPVASVLKFFSNDYMPVFVNDAVQTNAVAGEIDTVVINAAGSGYNNGTYDNVAINGDGTGGRVSIVVDGGKIISATVTSGGTGYTFGKISIDNITGIGTGTSAQVDVIIPPPGGHGADSVVELGAFRVMINAKLSYDEGAGDFPIDNDYRRIGLVTNPLKFGTAELISDLTVSAAKAVIFPPTFQGNYVPDEIITQTRVVGGTNVTARGRVISWNPTTKVLKYYQNSVDGIFPEVTGTQNEFDGSNVVSGATSGAAGQPDINFPAVPNSSSRTINNTEYDLGMKFNTGYAKPEIESNSGDVVYIDNRRAISRANDQVEDIKIVIEF